MPSGYILAFDYGLKHIGVAVGQFVTKTASPLTTLVAKDGVPTWTDIMGLIREWRPTALVVGLPINMDESESAMSLRARIFGGALAKHSDIPVTMIDERLSTRAARQIDPGKSHEIAAVLIAETWLGQSPP
jgi:putative Holliday junction resolvase